MARTLSAGSIVGATIGSVMGFLLILLCISPFILRAYRKRRRRGDEGAEPEMGLASPMSIPESIHFPRDLSAPHHPSMDRFSPATNAEYPPRPIKLYEANGAVNGLAGAQATVQPGYPPSPPYLPGVQTQSTDVSPTSTQSPQSATLDKEGVDAQDRAPPGPAPWEVGPEGGMPVRASTFGSAMTMTWEPESMEDGAGPARSSASLKSAHHHNSISKAIHDMAHKASEAYRRSSTHDSYGAPTRSATLDMDGDLSLTSSAPPVFPMWDEIPTGGLSADYYSGAPLSPPEEPNYTLGGTATTYPPGAHGLVNMISLPESGNAGTFVPMVRDEESQSPEQLGPGFAPPPAAPLTPRSASIKNEDMSDDDVSTKAAPVVFDSFAQQKPAIKPPPSPQHPAPGTVNPMDIMKPSNPAEQDWMVTAELEAIKNPPPPPQIPQFTAVVRQPTQTFGHDDGIDGLPREESSQSQDISNYATPPPDRSSSSPSNPSNQNTPDTRLTEPDSSFSPSPTPSRSSNNPTTPNTGQDYHSQDGNSPRAYRCEQCSRVFDQVHKLNHHKRYHERPHECTHCDKRFGTKTHLDRHINDKHMKTKKYHCIVSGCPYSKQGGKSFPRKDNWRRHMANKHSMNPEHDPPEAVDEPMGGV